MVDGQVNGTNGTHTNGDAAHKSAPSSYALPKSHQDLMEKSLVETDPEIAEIMVRHLHPLPQQQPLTPSVRSGRRYNDSENPSS
ncbi:hypothetical protein LTR28_013212 [Elasticomyces elasticus]|nr:hypothetical protein LTR28_013212 [Elasticomyces elasticus]